MVRVMRCKLTDRVVWAARRSRCLMRCVEVTSMLFSSGGKLREECSRPFPVNTRRWEVALTHERCAKRTLVQDPSGLVDLVAHGGK
jgi:hypothetical protein